jgi:raffinose/stachyose/melibiose transport system substrate-binding protein
MRFQAALRLKLMVALIAALTLLLVGCGGDDDEGAATTGGGTTAAEEATDPAQLGEVTLVVWDQEVRGGQAEAIKKLNQQFQQKYPNITLRRSARSFTDLQATLRLAASGPNPPDVVEVNNGYSAMGPLVTAGLLKPLDEYADRYGWADRYSEGLLKMNQFTEDGKSFGTGNLYGVPMTGEVVGAYYNKAKLRKLGLDLPTTFEEFEAALQKAKAGGEVPIQFGNLDKWTGIHEYEEIQLQQIDKAAARDFIFAESSAGFDNDDNLAAAQKLQEWTENGYFTEGFAGLGYDPSWQQFGEGKGVFLITGSWLTADLKKALGDDVGFFLLPPPEGGSLATLGGEGLPWAISSKTTGNEAEAAAAYIDFLTSDESMQVITDAGQLPATRAQVTVPSGLDTEVFDAWTTANEEDAIVPYLDWATPTMYDTITAAVQELMAARATPNEFVAKVQSDYEKFHEGEG